MHTYTTPVPHIISIQIPELFDEETFVVSNITGLGILVTFGAVFPLVAVVVAVSIFLSTYFTQIMIGRFAAKIRGRGRELAAYRFVPCRVLSEKEREKVRKWVREEGWRG